MVVPTDAELRELTNKYKRSGAFAIRMEVRVFEILKHNAIVAEHHIIPGQLENLSKQIIDGIKKYW